MKRLALLSFSALVLVTMWLFQPKVTAQSIDDPTQLDINQAPGLEISPAILDINGQPGESIDIFVSVTNTSEEAVGVEVAAKRADSASAEIVDESLVEAFDASNWIKVNQNDRNLLLDVGETRLVAATVTISEQARPGGHYANLRFRVVPASTSSGDVEVNPELVATVLVTTPGEVIEQLSVKSSTDPGVVFGGNVGFELFVVNTGTIHSLQSSVINIYDSNQSLVDRINLNQSLVLPNTQERIIANWGSNRAFGKFTATIETNYGSPTQKTYSDIEEFWVMPSSLNIALIMVVLIALTLTIIKRSINNKAKELDT